jgi:alpha-methylacyl-CoA racemase
MVDGVSLLTTGLYRLATAGTWHGQRQANVFDGSRPYYTTYRTGDGGHIAVGSLDRQFWGPFLSAIGLDDTAVGLDDSIDAESRNDTASWERTHRAVAGRIAERAMDEWSELLAASDTCATPVVPFSRVANHPHHRSRDSFVEIAAVLQPRQARASRPRQRLFRRRRRDQGQTRLRSSGRPVTASNKLRISWLQGGSWQ